MDEADVFVEERNKGELERNALVSLLLGCLEYFSGKDLTLPSHYLQPPGAYEEKSLPSTGPLQVGLEYLAVFYVLSHPNCFLSYSPGGCTVCRQIY